ncbi:MAG: hypothetical protein OJF48_003278 [Afipia sp.]|jgi:hypothetical protein|nr:MAG: hypothetical protein OJF48_003278 [Afipia sp.]
MNQEARHALRISRAFIHWRRLVAINAAIIIGYAI